MTHAEILKTIRPKITVEYGGYEFSMHYAVTQHIAVLDCDRNEIIDHIPIAQFPTLIAFRSLVAKWLLDKGGMA